MSFLFPKWPLQGMVHALCSTRAGGVSQEPYTSLNVGVHVGDDAAAVQENRARIAALCTDMKTGAQPIFLHQKHETGVLELDSKSLTVAPDSIVADASVSGTLGVACAVQIADCLPALFASADGAWVGAAHVGWRGLQAGVLETTVAALRAKAGSSAVLYAWLGPCIGPTRFEVGSDVLQAFMDTASPDIQKTTHACFYPAGPASAQLGALVQNQTLTHNSTPKNASRYLCDLAQLARIRLQALEITKIYGNNSEASWCTYLQEKWFFSHRRDSRHRGASGRMTACIWRRKA